MYPETDVLPVSITQEYWDSLVIPELLDAKAARYTGEHGLDPSVARQVAFSENQGIYEQAVELGISPPLAARTLIATLKELSRGGLDIQPLLADRDSLGGPTRPPVLEVLIGVRDEIVAKEAIPDVLERIVKGEPAESVMNSVSSRVSDGDLEALARKIVDERMPFVREKGMGALGPLMGIMMKEVRGAVDGKKVSHVLKSVLSDALSR